MIKNMLAHGTNTIPLFTKNYNKFKDKINDKFNDRVLNLKLLREKSLILNQTGLVDDYPKIARKLS